MNRMQAKIAISRWVVIENLAEFKILGMTLANSSWIHEEIKKKN